jgi:rhodanese-related sulfurtransferase
MEIKRITPEQTKELLDSNTGYIYLDVRTVPEFGAGHIPDAKNIPVVEPDASGRMLLNPRFVEITEANFGKDVKCITGCQKGGRSIKAAELLLTAGFPNVLDMRGGFGGETDEVGQVTFPGWSLRHLPTTRDSAAEDRYEDLAKKLLSSPRQTNS